jgi:cytochrome c-type biogenesis protein CcmF
LFILIFLVLVIGVSLLLFAWRAPNVGLGQRFGMLSRETMLLLNNMLLTTACAGVLLGTLYPLFLDAMGMGKISVGPPYFDTVFASMMAPLLLLLGVGPLVRWKNDEFAPLARRLSVSLVLALAAALATGWLAGKISLATTGGLFLGWWIVLSVATDLWERLRPSGKAGLGLWGRMRQLPRGVVGLMLAHVGVAVFALGVSMVKTYEVERDVKMGPNTSTEIAGYRFSMLRPVQEVRGPNYTAAEAEIEITRDGQKIAVLKPQKRIYRVQNNPMTEAGVDSNLWRDLYVSMGEELPNGDWIVRVQHKPFIAWIWLGCLIMMLGGIVAASDRRYRVRSSATLGKLEGSAAAVTP